MWSHKLKPFWTIPRLQAYLLFYFQHYAKFEVAPGLRIVDNALRPYLEVFLILHHVFSAVDFFFFLILPHSSNGVARSTRLLIRQSRLPQHHHQRSVSTAGLRIWGDLFVIRGSCRLLQIRLKRPYFTLTPFWNNLFTNLENSGMLLNPGFIPVLCPSSRVLKLLGQTILIGHFMNFVTAHLDHIC